MKKPKLVKEGDDLLLVFTPGAQKQFNIDKNTTYTEEVVDGKIVITLNTSKRSTNSEEDVSERAIEIAEKIMKKYEPAFKKLAKK